MPAINWLDFILIILLIAGMAIGYFQGLLRQVIGLAALYIGAIVATQYFTVLARALKDLNPGASGIMLNAMAFFIIFMGVMAIINFLSLDAYSMSHLRLHPVLDHIGGIVIGAASMWAIITIALSVLGYTTSIQSWAAAESTRQVLAHGIATSQIAAATSSATPLIMSAIRPWVPSGVPALFNL